MDHPRVIALVEDQDDIRAQLEHYLSRVHAHQVISASNGLHGAVLVALHRPSVLIADLYMPLADGVQMLRALREASKASKDDWYPRMAVVCMSGVYAIGHEKTREAEALGAVVLPKPFAYKGKTGLEALDEAVRDAIEKAQSRTGEHDPVLDDEDTVSMELG
jgi:DNA-binding NtrC family response regulator